MFATLSCACVQMGEELAGVQVECSTPLSLYQQEKQGTQSWLFNIRSTVSDTHRYNLL